MGIVDNNKNLKLVDTQKQIIKDMNNDENKNHHFHTCRQLGLSTLMFFNVLFNIMLCENAEILFKTTNSFDNNRYNKWLDSIYGENLSEYFYVDDNSITYKPNNSKIKFINKFIKSNSNISPEKDMYI